MVPELRRSAGGVPCSCCRWHVQDTRPGSAGKVHRQFGQLVHFCASGMPARYAEHAATRPHGRTGRDRSERIAAQFGQGGPRGNRDQLRSGQAPALRCRSSIRRWRSCTAVMFTKLRLGVVYAVVLVLFGFIAVIAGKAARRRAESFPAPRSAPAPAPATPGGCDPGGGSPSWPGPVGSPRRAL
jgi:hypothetical protein